MIEHLMETLKFTTQKRKNKNMAAPIIHAESSAKRYGGKAEDYIDIHELMDSSKSSFPDNRHRCMTHNIWFCVTIIPKIFGHSRVNSDGKKYICKDIAEQHCLEDFRMKFIPSVQDYLENLEMKSWMNNGMGTPPSAQKLYKPKVKEIEVEKEKENTKAIDELTEQPTINVSQIELPTIDPETVILDGNFGNAYKVVMDGQFANIHNIKFPIEDLIADTKNESEVKEGYSD